MKSKIILHIDMDYFFAQVEERENPRFKGKPVIVGADPNQGRGRGVVSTANYEAREYGVHSAMPISKAYQLCPEAIFLPVDKKLYNQVSKNIMKIIRGYSKDWEPVSLDEAYLDISFLRSFNKAKQLGQKLRKEIFNQEELTSTVGIGPNKLVARVAAEIAKPNLSQPPKAPYFQLSGAGGRFSQPPKAAYPNGLMVVKPAQVESFLSELGIEQLPGIGSKTATKLRKLEVQKIKDLKKLPKSKVKNLFGKRGELIYDRARGIDQREVASQKPVKSIGKEYTFPKNTRDPKLIFKTFEEILDEVHQRLNENFSFKTITVICRLEGFETHTKSKTLSNFITDREVLEQTAKKLLLEFFMEYPKPIRLIGLRDPNPHQFRS